jgi:hypothetical protein
MNGRLEAAVQRVRGWVLVFAVGVVAAVGGCHRPSRAWAVCVSSNSAWVVLLAGVVCLVEEGVAVAVALHGVELRFDGLVLQFEVGELL